MKVPFLDVRAATIELEADITESVARVVASGAYILGPELEAFEVEWASFTEASYCIGVGNGLDAIELALRALDIGPGDEVIVPANTFIATWLAVTRLGASLIPVEPLVDTYNINPAAVVEAISERTRAVVAVHLYGQPADVAALKAICHEHGIALVEDAAQAHGAVAYQRPAGSWGDLAAWSFYPGKNLGALGDAGAVTTQDASLAAKVRRLRNYGSDHKYVHTVQGFNSRLDELQAAVLRAKLRHLTDWNSRRRFIARRYIEELAETGLQLPHVPPWAEPVWHLFVVRTSHRERFRHHMTAHGIETLIHYPTPPHKQAAYTALSHIALPITEHIHREVVSLPIGPHMREDQIDHVIAAARSFQQ
jgi:dTDP-4-amino-4,6-dideoxygalactose transaminase